ITNKAARPCRKVVIVVVALKGPPDSDPVPRIEIVIDFEVDLLAADGFGIGAALAAGSTNAAGATAPLECGYIQTVDRRSSECGISLIKVVRPRHRCQEPFDIATLVRSWTQGIPRRAGDRRTARTIRLRKRTAIHLNISEHAIAPEAACIRA